MRKLKFTKLTANFEQKEDIILRDFLALERTSLANERTLFSYIRTGFYLILVGIGFLNIIDLYPIRWVGYCLFGLSFVLFVFGIVRYKILDKKLRKFYAAMRQQKKR